MRAYHVVRRWIILAILVLPPCLAATPAAASEPRSAELSAPLLEAVHPAVIAAFELLASLTALVAFPPRGMGLGQMRRAKPDR